MAKLTVTVMFTVQFDEENNKGEVHNFEQRRKAAKIVRSYFLDGMSIGKIQSQTGFSKIHLSDNSQVAWED